MDPNESLCNKDPRNPTFSDLYGDDDEKPVPRKGCSCDNCFYGRDALALELIRYREALEWVEANAMDSNCRRYDLSHRAHLALHPE